MKRLLSILLALSLVISLIPAAFAAEEPVTYNLTSDYLAYLWQVTEYESMAGYELKDETSYPVGNANWHYFGAPQEVLDLATNSNVLFIYRTNGIYMRMKKAGGKIGADFALALKAPEDKGFYIPSVTMNMDHTTARGLNWYMKKHDDNEITYEEFADKVGKFYMILDTAMLKGDVTQAADKAVYSDGETELITAFQTPAAVDQIYKSITLTEVQGAKLHISADKTVLDTTTNKTATVTSTVEGTNLENPMEVAGGFVKYYNDNPAAATVDEKTGVITAVAPGEANITAKSSDGVVNSVETITITVKEQDTALTGAFIQDAAKKDITGSYTAPTVAGLEINGSVINPDSNGDGSYNLTAPETKGDKKFLYWAKGMETEKRIISFSNVLEKYVPDSTGITYLIAVYEGDIKDTKNEYYNINGQLIAKQADAPADLPSIPGLGTAEGWKHCNSNIYVAEYAAAAPTANITITAGDNCTLNKTEKYAYGEKVTCTASGEGTFKCWKKNDEIVSIDESYTFHAWEDCTVEAVYEDHYYTGSNMNILIDSFSIDTGVTGVMAEFIGFENADVVEKGIMFTATGKEAIKIPMTTTDNQLTVVADENGTYEGYAILRNETAFNLITDGLYEHK